MDDSTRKGDIKAHGITHVTKVIVDNSQKIYYSLRDEIGVCDGRLLHVRDQESAIDASADQASDKK